MMSFIVSTSGNICTGTLLWIGFDALKFPPHASAAFAVVGGFLIFLFIQLFFLLKERLPEKKD